MVDVPGPFLFNEGLTLTDLNKRLDNWIGLCRISTHGSAPYPVWRPYPPDPGGDKDRTISLDGRLYEAPVPLIGRTATLLYRESDPARVELLYDGASYGMLIPLDVHVNVRVKRARQAVEIIPEREYAEEKDRRRNGQVFGREE